MSQALDSDIELQNVQSAHLQDGRSEVDSSAVSISPPPEVEHDSLPPADHGKQAYLVLLGCTLIQAPIWGKHIQTNSS